MSSLTTVSAFNDQRTGEAVAMNQGRFHDPSAYDITELRRCPPLTASGPRWHHTLGAAGAVRTTSPDFVMYSNPTEGVFHLVIPWCRQSASKYAFGIIRSASTQYIRRALTRRSASAN